MEKPRFLYAGFYCTLTVDSKVRLLLLHMQAAYVHLVNPTTLDNLRQFFRKVIYPLPLEILAVRLGMNMTLCKGMHYLRQTELALLSDVLISCILHEWYRPNNSIVSFLIFVYKNTKFCSKRVKVRNHSYENDFDLNENETTCRTHFHMKGETEEQESSEMAYRLSRRLRWLGLHV